MGTITYPFYSVNPLRMGVDGNGVTTLVGGRGCPLRCKWCLNEHLQKLPIEAPTVTVEELYEKVKEYNLYFLATGGGLTFGGGESLLHSEFIAEFASKYQNGWKYNVETSLAVPWENIQRVLRWVDCYIVDIKTLNPEIYHGYTGGDLALAKENLKRLLQEVGSDKIWVRVPLIPEWNSKEDQEQTKEQLEEWGITQIELFSYVKK